MTLSRDYFKLFQDSFFICIQYKKYSLTLFQISFIIHHDRKGSLHPFLLSKLAINYFSPYKFQRSNSKKTLVFRMIRCVFHKETPNAIDLYRLRYFYRLRCCDVYFFSFFSLPYFLSIISFGENMQ